MVEGERSEVSPRAPSNTRRATGPAESEYEAALNSESNYGRLFHVVLTIRRRGDHPVSQWPRTAQFIGSHLLHKVHLSVALRERFVLEKPLQIQNEGDTTWVHEGTA